MEETGSLVLSSRPARSATQAAEYVVRRAKSGAEETPSTKATRVRTGGGVGVGVQILPFLLFALKLPRIGYPQKTHPRNLVNFTKFSLLLGSL